MEDRLAALLDQAARRSPFVARWRTPAVRFVRFGIVGASGTAVNEGLLALGHGVWHLPLLLASAIAIECAIISNYLLNDRWTFKHRRPAWSRFLRFNTVSLVSLVVNLGILALLTRATHMHYLWANIIGIGIAFLVNFTLNVYWTYGKALSQQDEAERAQGSAVSPPMRADGT